MGNGTDDMTVAVVSRRGWPVRVHVDANGSGTLDGGDPLLSAPATLAMGDTADLLVVVDVPGSATVRGMVDTLDVDVTSLYDATATDALFDELFIQSVGIVVTLTKAVDQPSGTIGDVLTYTITYNAVGPATATNLVITDPIPAGATYLSGTLTIDGLSVTDATDADNGSFEAGNNRVVFTIGDVSGGATGTVTFQVRIG